MEYRKLMGLKRQVLEQLADEFFQKKPAARFARYKRFLETHPHGEDYAEFRAAQERQRSDWQHWSESMRQGQLTEKDYDQRNKQYHLYVQWVATNQLENLAKASGGGLYLDLPLGVRPDGYDVWRWHDYYACEASAGSPPDAMWTKGQNWGFPPLHPERIREAGYRHVRDYLRHHLRLARILRIDHVMQLHRLYCVPHGLGAHQGAYVQYRPEEFYAILNLESHRCRAALVGENLGTVPPEVNQAMQKHFVQPMYVVQYEIAEEEVEEELAEENQNQPAAKATVLRNVPADSLASMNTHDMATFAAWWRGEDIWLRRDLDLIDQQEADRQYEELQTIRNELINWLRSNNWLEDSSGEESQILMAIFKFLSAGPAEAVLVNLEDLWLETRPQNVPGTGSERPNWKRKAAVTYEEFTKSPEVLSILQMVARLRRQAQTEAMKQS